MRLAVLEGERRLFAGKAVVVATLAERTVDARGRDLERVGVLEGVELLDLRVNPLFGLCQLI